VIAAGSLLLLSNVDRNPNNSNLANTTSSDCDLCQWKALLAEGQWVTALAEVAPRWREP
jgi:hypothetical protein